MFILGLPIHGIAETKNKYLSKEIEFDINIEKLYEKYINNEYTIYDAYIKNLKELQKDEFESDVDFKSRIESICSRQLTGKLKFCDMVGFLINKKATYQNDELFVYDANNKELKVSINSTGSDYLNDRFNDYKNSIEISNKIISEKNYIGSNAYNKKINVSSATFDTYNLVCYMNRYTDLSYEIPMSVDDAKAMKKWGGIVIIGKLRYPFIGYYEQIFEPTISWPNESIFRNHYLALNLSEIWVVNRKTGKIFDRKIIEMSSKDDLSETKK